MQIACSRVWQIIANMSYKEFEGCVLYGMLLADPPRPFDFLIDGELLRKSLEKHLLDHDISTVSGSGVRAQQQTQWQWQQQ